MMEKLDLEGINFYFLYAFLTDGKRFEMDTLSGKTVPFFKDQWHDRHQVLYFWHSSEEQRTLEDFAYLYELKEQYADKADFWFINLTGIGVNEKERALKLAQDHGFDQDTILLDTYEEAAYTLRINQRNKIYFLKRDNFMFNWLGGCFDKHMVQRMLDKMIAAPLHYDID